MQPFTEAEHFVQNLGDGTFHHSGSLAVRFAVAAGTNITYKLPTTTTVAMTGGQDVLGQLKVPELHALAGAGGVKRVIVTTRTLALQGRLTRPDREVRHRDDFAAAQSELARVKGVTVLIHDQGCAPEKRRLRKRARSPTRGSASTSTSACARAAATAAPRARAERAAVETEFGRKTRSTRRRATRTTVREGRLPVVLGDRPRQEGGQEGARAARGPARARAAHPAPRFTVRMPASAARAWSRSRRSCRWPPCSTASTATAWTRRASPRRAARSSAMCASRADAIEGSNKASTGCADLLLGLDLLGAANPKNLAVADPERTVAIVNTAAVPTAAMVTNTGVRFPALQRNLDAIARSTRAGETCTSTRSTWRGAVRRPHADNLLLLAPPYQHGCLPVSAQAIEQAIRLNGARSTRSLAAFAWAARTVARPELVDDLLNPPARRPSSTRARWRSSRRRAPRVSCAGCSRSASPTSIGYQSAGYARRYAKDVMAVASVDAAVARPTRAACTSSWPTRTSTRSRGCTSTPSSAPESAPSSARARR